MFIRNFPGEIHDTVHLYRQGSCSQYKCVLEGRETEALTAPLSAPVYSVFPPSTEDIQFEMDKLHLVIG